MPRKKVTEKGPKIAPIRGYLRAQYVKCGRSNCHCRCDSGHGPYHYRVIVVNGRKCKEYIRKSDIANVRDGIDERRKQRSEVRLLNQRAKDTWRILKMEILETNRLLS